MAGEASVDPGGGVEAQGPSGSATLGAYQLVAAIGRGGTVDVYLAVARGPMGFQRLAVVKRLRAMLAADPAYLAMFLDEARLAARMNHPNLVHTYEVGEQDGTYFIAMEYLEGQPLHALLAETQRRALRVPTAVAIRIVADALLGLHHAHELSDFDGSPLGVVHRDVSPHNVFVCYDGQVKLMDFGIAKARSSSTVTEAGVLKGKVAYMSPEQAAGGKVDRRSDLFAMGIVLWELVAGRRLLSPDKVGATLQRLGREEMPRLSTAVPDVDARLDDLVARALARAPEARFPTALAMREALEVLLEESESASREAVGGFVAATFATAREEMRKQVQAHAARLAVTTQELLPLRLPSARGRGADEGAGTESGSALVASADVAALTPRPRRAAKVRRAAVVALLLGFVAGAAVIRLGQAARVAAAGAAGRAVTGSLVVSGPAGLRVHLAHRDLGRIPLTLAEAPTGEHVLVVERDDGARRSVPVVVRPGERTSVVVEPW